MSFEDSMNVQTGGAAKPVLVESRWFHFLRKCTRGHRVVLCSLSAFFTLSSYAGSLFYIPPSDGHVELSVDVFRDSEPTVVRAYGARQNQEYLLFQGQAAQAELIYSAMNNVGESFYEVDALEFFPFEFLARNETWKINRNQPKDWGVKTSYRSKLDPLYETQTFTYAPYRLVNSERYARCHPIPITSATATIPATTTDSATGTDTTRITGSALGSITSPLRDQGIGMDFICARNLLDRLGI